MLDGLARVSFAHEVRLAAGLYPVQRTIVLHHPVFDGIRNRIVRTDGRSGRGVHFFPVVRIEQRKQPFVNEFLFLDPEDRLEPFIPIDAVIGQIEVPPAQLRRVERHAALLGGSHEGGFGRLALNELRDALGDGRQVFEQRRRHHAPPEDGQHAHGASSDEQRVPGESHHVLPPRPRGVADVRIVKHVVGEQRPLVARDASDLELADRHPPVRAVEMGVATGARLEDQHPLRLVERPDPGKGSVQVVDDRLCAALQGFAQRGGAGQMHVDFAPGGGELPGIPGLAAQLQQGGHLPGEGLQGVGLQIVKLARPVIEHTDGAQGHAFPAADDRPGVEAQWGAATFRQIRGEARVIRQVWHHHQRFLLDRVAAHRALQRMLALPQPKLALEPLAFRVQEVDHRHRRSAKLGRELAQFVEFPLGRRVENAVAFERRQPQRIREFSRGERSVHGNGPDGTSCHRMIRATRRLWPQGASLRPPNPCSASILMFARPARSTAGHSLQLFGVAGSLHRDFGGRLIDFTQIVG